jgi:hypothetical protein
MLFLLPHAGEILEGIATKARQATKAAQSRKFRGAEAWKAWR